MRIADVAFHLIARHQGRHRVDDDDVYRVRLHEHLGDLQRLFAGGWLADEQRLQVHADTLGPARVKSVLSVDEGGDAARLLRVCQGVQRHGRLTA